MKRSVKSKARRTKYNRLETTKVRTVEILSPDQIARIDLIENDRDRSICFILLDTGLRIDELTNLNYSDVFTDIRRKQVKEVIQITGKGNKERSVPLTDRAINAFLTVHQYNQNNLGIKIDRFCPVLISRNLRRLHNDTIRKMIQDEIEANPHTFRHTCFTNLRKSNVNIEVIQKIAGHTSITTTEKYYLAVNTEDLIQAIKKTTESGIHLIQTA